MTEFQIDAAARALWATRTSESWDQRLSEFPDSADIARARADARAILSASGLLTASPAPPAQDEQRQTGWDYDEHPGDCHARKVDGCWVTCCRECAGTGVFPVPWIRSPEEGRARIPDSSCVSCKGAGVSVVAPAAPSVSTDHTDEKALEAVESALVEMLRGPWAGDTARSNAAMWAPGILAAAWPERAAALAEVDQLRTDNERALDERRERWKAVAIRRTAERDALQVALAKAEARIDAAQAEHDKHTESGRRTGLSVDCVCVGCRMAAALGVDPQKEEP